MYRAPRRDTVHVDSVFEEASANQRFRPCTACGGRTSRTNVVAHSGPYTEYDDVLIIDLHGGYGMFFDAEPHTVVLCHDCAHSACEALPWLNRLLDPYRSHAHTQEYKHANPGHFGWDYLEQPFDDAVHAFFTADACPTCAHPPEEHAYGDPAVGFTCYVCSETCKVKDRP